MLDLHMTPAPGAHLVRHAGDCIEFSLRPVPAGWQARLRTNIGRAARVRDEIVRSHFEKVPLAGASWRDLPMRVDGDTARLRLPLTEVGYFRAKPFALDAEGRQAWPAGPDAGIAVHPSWTRTSNLIYCAFPRMFGDWSRGRERTAAEHSTSAVRMLDGEGWTVVPPSGTLRGLIGHLPHIFDRLGCRILHLLPVSPVPTTFARFGRFGSPYAVQDLTAIDPALVEFDRRTTGVEQFVELTRAVHARGGRVMLDLVINHTGWGSREWNEHPEWFLKGHDGAFHSPGAWDVVWEDLVELDQRHVPLWDYLAKVFLTWCRRGVDAFRCDAGYKIPVHVWQFITARVRQEFPDTVFLLEGLGGSWEATNALLGDGGMQWAYSELFQNFDGAIGPYLEYAVRTSEQRGTLVHYSETHDNSRLAARGAAPDSGLTAEGRRWSLHRNRLSALVSVNGGFGFTNGVEWCATEQLNVHSSRGLRWDGPGAIVDELAALNRLLGSHPCFFDGARLTRLDGEGSTVFALRRDSAEGEDRCLVVVNTDFGRPAILRLAVEAWEQLGRPQQDLCTGTPFQGVHGGVGHVDLVLEAGAVHCLAASAVPKGLAGEAYRKARARADWAMSVLNVMAERPVVPDASWVELAAQVDRDPAGFLASAVPGAAGYPAIVPWCEADVRRRTVVPPGHWLLLEHPKPFRARLVESAKGRWTPVESVEAGGRHVAVFAPQDGRVESVLVFEELGKGGIEAAVAYPGHEPALSMAWGRATFHGPLALLTNGRGGMARVGVDLGRVTSKYDCLLGANLHGEVPVDRHVFAKRVRAWLNADGFITPLDAGNLCDFEPGPPAHWRFVANAGDGRAVEIRLLVDMLEGRNTTVLQFGRLGGGKQIGRPLPPGAEVRLIVRVDLEDRNFHWETKRNGAAEHHFAEHTRTLSDHAGFRFAPSRDRALTVRADRGRYHPQAEWSENLPHPVEATRGMTGAGDAWSPGWFEVPLGAEEEVLITVSADLEPPDVLEVRHFGVSRAAWVDEAARRAGVESGDGFGRRLVTAARAFVVRRDDVKTVIAGYPWFLDWGRDSLIAARGLLAAGMVDEVRQLILAFGRFEKDGTLPNSIHGDDASNRDTSDAPLWFGVVCEEYAAGPQGAGLYQTEVDDSGRTVAEVLRSIACGYLRGTPNGIRVDAASGLVWSPSHFTWMDTNHPAATPREGYPVEIQALWVRLLRQLAAIGAAPWEGRGESWADLAKRAAKSFGQYFWLEECGWPADCLLAGAGTPARTAAPSNALRSNVLFAVNLGLLEGVQARRTVEAVRRHLVVPGALRSLAPLPVVPPLPVYGNAGGLLNDPDRPYWPRYEGDEDTRRKPAYHNGTAWTWTFPGYCEALVRAYPGNDAARVAARAYLGTMAELLGEGCLGQIPEVMDGDLPHTHRGCDAQAWSVTEAWRVWRWLGG